MELCLKRGLSYSNVIVKLSLYTTLSVVGCILLGYIFLPFAAAYYGALLTFEKKEKRVMSYAIPAVLFTVNFFIRAAFSLEALAYIVLGVFLYFASKKGWSKSESAVWMTVITLFLLASSAILIAFEKTGSIGLLQLRQFYSNIYVNLKEQIIDKLMSLTLALPDGATVFLFDAYDAKMLFNEIVISTISVALILSFAIVGLTFKIYHAFLLKNTGDEPKLLSWRFGVSNLICYFYVIVALVSLVADNDGSIFANTLITLNTVLSAVFAYLGVRFVFHLMLSSGKSAFFAIAVIIIAFILFSSYIVSILSYLGVTVMIIENKALSVSK